MSDASTDQILAAIADLKADVGKLAGHVESVGMAQRLARSEIVVIAEIAWRLALAFNMVDQNTGQLRKYP